MNACACLVPNVKTSGNMATGIINDRGVNWGDQETRCLVQIWGEATIQLQLTGAVRNKKVWDSVAQKMTEHGYNKAGPVCRIRMKNLKHSYKKVKDHNNTSGNNPKTCKFFEEMDRVLGTRPATRPTFVLDTSSSSLEVFDEESDEEEAVLEMEDNTESIAVADPRPITPIVTTAITPTPKGRKRSRADVCQKMIDSSMEKFIGFQREQEKAMEEMEEKRMKLEEEAEKRREEREDRRRQEDREHELRLVQLLAGFPNNNHAFQPYQPTYHNL